MEGQRKGVDRDRLEVYVILTGEEGMWTREKGIEELNDVSDTVTRFRRVG